MARNPKIVLFLLLVAAKSQILYADATAFVREVIKNEIDFGEIAVGETAHLNFNLLGIDLDNDAILTISGDDAARFTVSPNIFTPVSRRVNNQNVTLYYTPTSGIQNLANLTIASGGAKPLSYVLKGTGQGDGSTTYLANATEQTQIFAHHGQLVVKTEQPQTVEIFNLLGQKLIKTTVVAGETTINIDQKGLLIVKTDKKTEKIRL